ncbi:hypothetical protein [Streptomyces goshikiensis]|uniref:hypothetical protein n=1 Tax=Streptomyces goshikiensis TaxID=1942 RepID=UPI0036B46206
MEQPLSSPEPAQIAVRDEMGDLAQPDRLQAEQQSTSAAPQPDLALPSGHVLVLGSPMRAPESVMDELVRRGWKYVVPAPVRAPSTPHRLSDVA